jgi:hypothetical protein
VDLFHLQGPLERLCDEAHKAGPDGVRSVCREHSLTMLLPSILKILDQNDVQLRIVESRARLPIPKDEEASGLRKIELEIAAAAELAKSSGTAVPPASAAASPGPFLEELRRAITKLEKPEQSRVVDVFE